MNLAAPPAFLPRRAHKTLLIDGHSAVESVFALLLPRVTEANSALSNFSELHSDLPALQAVKFFIRKFAAVQLT